MKSAKSVNSPAAFQLKGSMLTLTVLQLFQSDIEIFAAQLDQLVKKTPNFFRNAPIVIDLEKLLDGYHIIDFGRMKDELLKHGLIPVGVRHANDHHIKEATRAGLGIIPSAVGKSETKVTSEQQPTKTTNSSNSKIITQTVRSGQQVYAPGGDLIILSSVSPGAELMADGNIHVYGTLRGRALAGVNGDMQARIFCRKLEPELISIAGYYKLRDDIKVPKNQQEIQIYLAEEKLVIEAI